MLGAILVDKKEDCWRPAASGSGLSSEAREAAPADGEEAKEKEPLLLRLRYNTWYNSALIQRNLNLLT